jgi:two-component system CheB/CheR fusion protein
VLHLLAPASPRGLRLPIDFFLRSLAADQGPQGVGVVLSGMGSDGTLGLAAIKEKGGAVFVQAPASAKFDSMPRSAIDAGLADVVAPVEELAGKITAYLAQAPRIASPDLILASKTESAIEKICVLLRSQTGHDFSQYKRSTVYRRIERRMGLHQIDSIAGYLRYMQESPQETTLLFKELLIGVTNFFRDPEAWDHLQKKAIPALLAERPAGGVLRAWVPGCSTGEEAYSLAMVFREVLAELRPARNYSLQIFATDLDKDSIERARQGSYPTNIASDVSADRLEPILREGGARLSRAPGDPRVGGLRHAEHHHGSAVYQARHSELPQPSHLPGTRAADEAPSAFSLQPQARRHSLSGQRGDAGAGRRSLCSQGWQNANLSAARY